MASYGEKKGFGDEGPKIHKIRITLFVPPIAPPPLLSSPTNQQ